MTVETVSSHWSLPPRRLPLSVSPHRWPHVDLPTQTQYRRYGTPLPPHNSYYVKQKHNSYYYWQERLKYLSQVTNIVFPVSKQGQISFIVNHRSLWSEKVFSCWVKSYCHVTLHSSRYKGWHNISSLNFKPKSVRHWILVKQKHFQVNVKLTLTSTKVSLRHNNIDYGFKGLIIKCLRKNRLCRCEFYLSTRNKCTTRGFESSLYPLRPLRLHASEVPTKSFYRPFIRRLADSLVISIKQLTRQDIFNPDGRIF